MGAGHNAIWFSPSFSGDKLIEVNTGTERSGLTQEFLEEKCSPTQLTNYPIDKSTNRPLKAIIPVHLFGQMADTDPIMEVAKRYGLLVIEDACQAHGAEYKGRRAGSIGDVGCFSFYPGKNLGAYGEGGATFTNNAELDKNIRMLRDHGQVKKYYHMLVGWNGRMHGIQGAVLSVKQRHLQSWNEARRKNAKLCDELLIDLDGVTIPREANSAKHVYHIYAIRTKNRDALMNALAEKDIHCGIHYPVPVHEQEAYRSLELKKSSFPIAEKCAEEFVSLPMFPELSENQIHAVVKEIVAFNQADPDVYWVHSKDAGYVRTPKLSKS